VLDAVLVLEQTLGNAVHGRNLERVLAGRADVRGRVVRLHYDEASWRHRWPVLGNWTLESGLRARARVRRLLAERRADALYVHTAVPAALLLDVVRAVPTVLSTDATPRNLDTVAAGYGHRVRGVAVEQAKQRLTGTVYRAAVAVVAQSRWAARSLVEEYGVDADRVHVLAQGADLDAFWAGPARPATGRALRLLFVGADFERKGGPVLLEAVRQARAAHAGPVELDVVTARPLGAVPEGVRVHVGLDHADGRLAGLFRAADAFVLPTLSDASPLVLGEALAAGLPVVTTSVGAAPELAVEGVTGLVVAPGDAPALAAALCRLREDEELRLSMADRARALAVERYDAHANGGRVLDLLVEAGRHGRAGRAGRAA
jgi:glycosyltransferase involved in cell wall biosynthesis